MQGKYHIGVQGKPGKCTAKYICPFGDTNEHFDTVEEAQLHADEINEKRANSIDLKEGATYMMARNLDYDKLKKRTIEEQSLSEVERIEKLVKEEVSYLKNKLSKVNEAEMKRYRNAYENMLKAGRRYFIEIDTKYKDDPIDVDIYKSVRDNISLTPYNSIVEEEVNPTTFWQSLTGKPKNKLTFTPIYDDNIDLTGKNFGDDLPSDVLGVQMTISDPKTGRTLSQKNLSKAEADRLGVLAPGDNSIKRIDYRYHGGSDFIYRGDGQLGVILERSVAQKIKNAVTEKHIDLKTEFSNLDLLKGRISNYERLLEDIKEMKK